MTISAQTGKCVGQRNQRLSFSHRAPAPFNTLDIHPVVAVSRRLLEQDTCGLSVALGEELTSINRSRVHGIDKEDYCCSPGPDDGADCRGAGGAACGSGGCGKLFSGEGVAAGLEPFFFAGLSGFVVFGSV